MGYGPSKAFPVTMASGGTLTSEVNLGKSYNGVVLMIPSMTSAHDGISIYCSESSAGTFRILKHQCINSSTVTTNDYVISSSATNCYVPLPIGGIQYLKVQTSSTVAHGCTFKIICGD